MVVCLAGLRSPGAQRDASACGDQYSGAGCVDMFEILSQPAVSQNVSKSLSPFR